MLQGAQGKGWRTLLTTPTYTCPARTTLQGYSLYADAAHGVSTCAFHITAHSCDSSPQAWDPHVNIVLQIRPTSFDIRLWEAKMGRGLHQACGFSQRRSQGPSEPPHPQIIQCWKKLRHQNLSASNGKQKWDAPSHQH